MKVALVIPPRVDGRWIHREDKHAAAGRPIMPFTAPLLAAMIRRDLPEADVVVLEAQRDDLDLPTAKQRLAELAPDIAVVLMSWAHLPWDRQLAETDIPAIAMILHQFISRPEAIEKYQFTCPYVIGNEIEVPLVEGLREFARTGRIAETLGFLIRQDDGEWRDTGEAELADMTTFPMPDYETFDPEDYFAIREASDEIWLKYKRLVYMNTMKGCPFRCAYCGQANQRVRCQSVEQVLDQLSYFAEKHGVRRFQFLDNEFSVRKQRAKDICRGILDRGLDVEYIVNNRVELFDDELIDLLARSGCENVRLGIETCEPAMQKSIHKEISLDRAREVIHQLKEAGITTHCYMTPGLPGETRAALRANAKFLASTEIATFSCEPMFLIPGSEIYRTMRDAGRLTVTDWEAFRENKELCFRHDTYRNRAEVDRAVDYMNRLYYVYRWWDGLKRGKFDHRALRSCLYSTRWGLWIRNHVFQPLIRPFRGRGERS